MQGRETDLVQDNFKKIGNEALVEEKLQNNCTYSILLSPECWKLR